MRMMSACQSSANAVSDLSVTQLSHPYHCSPWVLIPRNCTSWLFSSHRTLPHTCSWPCCSTGVSPVPDELPEDELLEEELLELLLEDELLEPLLEDELPEEPLEPELLLEPKHS